jgi:pimeloyl-ACP methyl ester carboxylesterase
VLQKLCEHCQAAYDWRATERRLNRLPHYRTAIDGLSVHFIHLRSPVADAVPVIMTHGWPGSFFEFEQVIQRLADPAAFGEPPRPAFHVVVPSLPGYGFSEAPNEPGWNIHRIAATWAELMDRLGYSRFIALGSDWGTSISTCLALDHRSRLLGLHLIPPLVPPPARGTTLSELERAAIARLEDRNHTSRHIPRFRQQGLRHSDTPWSTHRSDSVPGSWRRCGPGHHQGALEDPQSGPGAGQHHVVLADPHGGLISSVVLGEHRRSYRLVHQTRWRLHHRSDWMHRLPTGDTQGPSADGPNRRSRRSSTGASQSEAATSEPGNNRSCSSPKFAPYPVPSQSMDE